MFACVPLVFNALLLTFEIKADNEFVLSVIYYCFHLSILQLLKVIKRRIFSNN